MSMNCAKCGYPIDPEQASDPCPECGSIDRNITGANHGSAMNQELLDRLKNTEDNFVERKPANAKRGEIRQTIVAFANSLPEGRTGIIYIGVRNDGSIEGVSDPDNKQKLIRSICEKDCYPSIVPRCEVVPTKDGSVVAVIIDHDRDRPHFSGPAYLRIGSENVAASEKIFNELITTRLDKPYEILKWKGKIVTVVASGKILGKPKYLRDSSYYATHECEIENCTPHYVNLLDITARQHLSEPLENVTLATDEERFGRLKLIVTERTK